MGLVQTGPVFLLHWGGLDMQCEHVNSTYIIHVPSLATCDIVTFEQDGRNNVDVGRSINNHE